MYVIISKPLGDNYNKVAEIKALRGASGLGLKEAKEAIEEMKMVGTVAIPLPDDDTIKMHIQKLEHEGFSVDTRGQSVGRGKICHTLSGKYLSLVKEAIQDDQQALAIDMIDTYINHFEA